MMSSDSLSQMDVAALRRDYMRRGLDESDLAQDPLTQFEAWFREALGCPTIQEPNAMVLATVSADGRPHARFVLLKGFGPEGFVFFSNNVSDKARDLDSHPNAALTFGWLELERQVRIEGSVSRVSRKAVEAYFKSRPRGSQLGAWVSRQSEVIEGRAVLEQKLVEADARFPGEIPVPDTWGGYCVAPERIEFWQGRTNRLHDRLCYLKSGGTWTIVRLSP